MHTKHPLAEWRAKQVPPMSQEDLAEKIEVSRWMVNRIETGNRSPSRDLITRIKAATEEEVGFDQLVPKKPGVDAERAA